MLCFENRFSNGVHIYSHKLLGPNTRCFVYSQINGYILCGKLKSAYLIAVKAGRVDDVRHIAAAADRTGQAAVKGICEKWLQQKAPKP